MESVKRKIVFYWLTHFYLRRIGKRYPDYFIKQISDLTDNYTARRIMAFRYVNDPPMKFESIAYELNMDVRNVFSYHKKVIDKIISG